MAKVSDVFVTLLKPKTKSAFTLFILQVIASFVLTIGIFFTSTPSKLKTTTNHVFSLSGVSSWLLSSFFTFLFFCTMFDLVYLWLSAIRNEKINTSQTFRLIPINEHLLYLANLLSSLVSILLLGLAQFAFFVVGFGSLYSTNHKFSSLINYAFRKEPDLFNQFLNYCFFVFVYLLCVVLTIYLFISFANFSSKAISDFLPFGSSKFAIFIVRLVVVITALYLFTNKVFPLIANSINGISNLYNLNVTFVNFMLQTILELFIFDLVLYLINTFLFSKFVESKA